MKERESNKKEQESIIRELRYRKIDAFTGENSNSVKSSGNPAACIYLEEGQKLTPDEMQRIAAEHKGFVSEVVFCTPYGEMEYELRYYSSECEVDFCGHGTIACMYQLLLEQKQKNTVLNDTFQRYDAQNQEEFKSTKEIIIHTKNDILKVYNEIDTSDAVYITAPAAESHPCSLTREQVAKALSIHEDDLAIEYPVELINAGLNTLIVPINSLEKELTVNPDEASLKTFCMDNLIDIILIFTKKVSNNRNHMRSRVFAPKFGYLEDKATGSGNSALGYYMLKHQLWEGTPIYIEQNGEMEDYNIVMLKTLHNRVLFGGSSKLKIEGKYYI